MNSGAPEMPVGPDPRSGDRIDSRCLAVGSCARCNPVTCLCKCHDPAQGHDQLCEWDEVLARVFCSRAHDARVATTRRRGRARLRARLRRLVGLDD